MSNSINSSIDNIIIDIKYTYLKDLLKIYWEHITVIKKNIWIFYQFSQ